MSEVSDIKTKMEWRMHVLILIALLSLNHAKDEKKKAIIITVDELKPEESDVIISDLTIKEQRNIPTYHRKERSYSGVESNPLEKHLDYILVHPEDLKVLKNLEGVTVEKPKFVKYPDSSSGEIYETDGYSEYPEEKKSYSNNAGYPRSPSSKTRSGINKYPSRPAPPLTAYSGGDENKGERDPNYSPYVHKDYPGYASPGYSYNAPYSSNAPKVLPISSNAESNYGPSPQSTYTGPSSYSSPSNSYESSKPSSYSGTSSYSAPGSSKSTSYSDPSSYGNSKPPYSGSSHTRPEKSPKYSRPSSYSAPGSSKSTSYSAPSSYGNSKPASHSSSSYTGAENPSHISGPSSYSHPTRNKNSKSSSYSGPSSYDTSKPNYSTPSTYETSKPSSYSSPSTYGSSKPNSYSRPSTYENTRPSSYSGPSSYGSSNPSSYFGPPSYGSSKPSSYSGSYSYPGPESNYGKSKPSSYYTTSTYSGPGSSHSSYKPPNSGPRIYSSQSSPLYHSSAEKYTDSEKYTSHPESYDQHKTHAYHDYNPSKPLSHDSSYEIDSDYTTPNKPYKSGYYNPPSVTVEPVKHISYDDLPSPYRNPPHARVYDSLHSTYKDDLSYETPKDTYGILSKPHSETDYRNSPSKKKYIPLVTYKKDKKYVSHDSRSFSSPAYEKKTTDGLPSSANFKPRNPYNPNYQSDSYEASPSPKEQYPRKHSYGSLKTSYGTGHEPSSYEEPVTKYNTQHYPPSYKTASEVSYVPPSSSYNENHPRTLNQKYEDSKPKVESGHYSAYDSPPTVADDISYKSSPVLSKQSSQYDDSPYNDKNSPSSYYKNPLSYPTHSNLEYGARYPTSYRKTRHTESKIINPTSSKFTLEDARSPDHVETYKKKNSETDLTETHSHYHHFHDDSSEIPDNHAAKKNYSPVRPAPLHDELEQPRHPPLPRRSKQSKKYYDSEEDHSKESVEDHKTHPRYSTHKTYNPHNSEYRDSYDPSYTHSDVETNYPASSQNKNYHYSDHSSEETDDEPRIYTTTTTTYTKPYKDESNEHDHNLDYHSGNSYKQPDFSKKKIHDSKVKNFETSQPEYSRPTVYRGSQMFSRPFIYSRSKPYTSEAQTKEPMANSKLPITYSSLSEILPPKRVEGVVYRSRQSYPHVKAFQRYKGYLPYKPRLSKSIASHDYKPYESLPSEVREKNVTSDRPGHVLAKSVSIKSKNAPQKKRLRYASIEISDESKDSSEDSNLDAIPGEPGKDYPILKEIPHNGFTCENKLPGFYADVENRCQVYYQCSKEGRLQSFLCPNGTIFNQLTFVCEWWHNVDCSKSEKYFAKNNQLYKSAPTPIKRKRTVKEKYIRPSRPETRANYNLESFYADDSEEFNRRKNGRRRRQSGHIPHKIRNKYL